MPATASPAAPSGSPSGSRSRSLALGVLATGMLMTILDGSIVTVAMPAIQSDLGFTPVGLSWVVNAYLIAFGSLLLLAGRLGDLIGRRRMFLAGTAVFTAASLLAGVATSPGILIAARFLQGVGSAMASAVSLGILVTLFTEPRERARAIAVFSFTGAAGASIGQVLGGVLTDALTWNWIFFINLPIGAATLLVALRALPADRAGRAGGGSVDLLGAPLVTAGLMTGIYAVVKIEEYGASSAHTLGLGALSLALLAGFVLRQARAAHPLMPLRIFRSRSVSGANLVQMLMVAALFSFQILVALHLQKVLGYGAAETGLAMLPAALVIGAVSLGVSARLNARFGERAVLLTGLALLVVMLGLLTRVPVHASYVTDLLPVMLLAAGFGLALPALTSLGMSGAKESDAGLASGLFNTTQQIGMALGIAVLSTLAAARTTSLTEAGRPAAEALTSGHHLAFGVGAGLLVAAFAVALTVLRQPKPGREGSANEGLRQGPGQDQDQDQDQGPRPEQDQDPEPNQNQGPRPEQNQDPEPNQGQAQGQPRHRPAPVA
ncbi:DHA2 family efflux MFS transporter permease subunit [Streptomyces sp. NPDC090127]|uniref:DHA2 family efflux MFS transporter permease subunit n=1 Tax=Streptomyces sp. NPDC090127 TaxID=3365953 RepID=UPI003804FEB2